MTLPPKITTTIRNRLRNPNDTGRSAVKIDLIVRGSSTWAKPSDQGRILGENVTWTNTHGCWWAELLPYTMYEDWEYVYVEIREGGMLTGYIRVPPKPVTVACWIRDLLIDPPSPPVPRPIIATLAALHDVDRDSVEQAPEGAVLIKRDGMWRAEVPSFGKDRLAELYDVDESVTWAEPDNVLTYLSHSQGWGVTTPKPATITAYWDYDPDNPSMIWVGVDAFDRSKTLEIYWGDNTANTPVPKPEVYAHTYSKPGSYYLSVYYSDESESAIDTTITIPKPA